MNEAYQELREQLRKQHALNVNEVYGKRSYHKDSVNIPESDKKEPTGFPPGFKWKLFCFAASILLCSIYIYGNGDIKKGADMAWQEITVTVSEFEKGKPIIQDTITYCKKGYYWLKNTTKQLEEDK